MVLVNSVIDDVTYDVLVKSPKCHILCGNSGSGKTYASRLLVKVLNHGGSCSLYVSTENADEFANSLDNIRYHLIVIDYIEQFDYVQILSKSLEISNNVWVIGRDVYLKGFTDGIHG